jgi:hypothetical protein
MISSKSHFISSEKFISGAVIITMRSKQQLTNDANVTDILPICYARTLLVLPAGLINVTINSNAWFIADVLPV